MILESTYGSLTHAAMHEAGHMIAARSVGFTVQEARLHRQRKPGVGEYWKGVVHLRLPAKPAEGSPAVAKLGGSVGEHFIDRKSQAFRVPSYRHVVSQRFKLSRTDHVTEKDLGGISYSKARQTAYESLSTQPELLRKMYQHLLDHQAYP